MKCKKQKIQSSEVNNNAFTVLLPRGGQAGGGRLIERVFTYIEGVYSKFRTININLVY